MNNLDFIVDDNLVTFGNEVDLELGKGEEEVQRDCNSNDGLKIITGNNPMSMVLQLLVGNQVLKNFFISGEFDEDK